MLLLVSRNRNSRSFFASPPMVHHSTPFFSHWGIWWLIYLPTIVTNSSDGLISATKIISMWWTFIISRLEVKQIALHSVGKGLKSKQISLRFPKEVILRLDRNTETLPEFLAFRVTATTPPFTWISRQSAYSTNVEFPSPICQFLKINLHMSIPSWSHFSGEP